MSSCTIYKLRKSYNDQQSKRFSDSKSKVYTFNQYQNDFIHQTKQINPNQAKNKLFFRNNPIKQKQSLINQQKVIKNKNQFSPKHKQLIQLNKQNLRSQNSLQINRYLKEYQYNCYRLDNQKDRQQTKQRKLSRQSHINLNQRSSNLPLKQIRQSKQTKICNRNINCQSKFYKSFNQQLIQNQKPYRNSLQNFKIANKLPQQTTNNQPITNLCSKQQISLIKLLRQQNNQLKNQLQKISIQLQMKNVQLQKKTVYIQQMQKKLQQYLIDRLQIQTTIQNNTKLLQNSINQSQSKIQSTLLQLNQTLHQLDTYKTIFHKLYNLFQQQKLTQNSISQFNLIQIQKLSHGWLSQLTQFFSYKKLVYKIQQMKQKIQINRHLKQNHIRNHQSQFQSVSSNYINLHQLWRWLKKVGKQYQIMTQKVLNFSNKELQKV